MSESIDDWLGDGHRHSFARPFGVVCNSGTPDGPVCFERRLHRRFCFDVGFLVDPVVHPLQQKDWTFQ